MAWECTGALNHDNTAAAWGLFQVRFAFLVQELASAVFYLRRRREPTLQFAQVFKKSLDQLIDALSDEFDFIVAQGHALIEIDETRAITIPQIRALKDWRDPRIHARVTFEGGIALYNWRTGKQLDMTAHECDKKCDLAISLAVQVAGSVRSMLTHLKADETLVSEIRTLLDSPDPLT